MNDLSSTVLKKLRDAGWQPDRDEGKIESEFQRIIGEQWLPNAGPFIRMYGGLNIAHTLWIWASPIVDDEIQRDQQKVSKVVNSKVMPVASSSYLGDGCIVFIDAAGRFYAVDSEGMIYVGCNEIEALNVLVGGSELPAPPRNLEEAIRDAYEWH